MLLSRQPSRSYVHRGGVPCSFDAFFNFFSISPVGMDSAQRIALRYRVASGMQSVDSNLEATKDWRDVLALHLSTMEDLIAAGERRRLGRIGPIKIQGLKWDGSSIKAMVQGTGESYSTRITVSPRRGHHCTCPDWAKRGKQIGPCKHVLALGKHWKQDTIDPAIAGMEDRLISILESATL